MTPEEELELKRKKAIPEIVYLPKCPRCGKGTLQVWPKTQFNTVTEFCLDRECGYTNKDEK